MYREMVGPRFYKWWQTLLIGLLFASFWYMAAQLERRGFPWVLWIGGPFLGGLFFISQASLLIVEVEKGTLRVRVFPWQRKFRTYSLSGLRRAEVWNRASWYHKEFTLPGWKCIFLELSDGTRLVLSSRDPERLLSAVREGGAT